MRIIRLVIFTYAILLFAGETAFAIDNLRVAYPSMNTSVFALVIAQKEGYFKEEGLNVELLSIRGEIAIRTTLAGEVDFFTNAGSALAAAVRGVPVRLVTVFQDKPGWDLISEPEIKSIAQLRGKTIGIMYAKRRPVMRPGDRRIDRRHVRPALRAIFRAYSIRHHGA